MKKQEYVALVENVVSANKKAEIPIEKTNKRSFDYKEFNIGSHFLSALINSDSSGLSDEEVSQLTNFEKNAIASLPAHKSHHWAVQDDGYNEFGHDDVTGLKGSVEQVNLVFFPN